MKRKWACGLLSGLCPCVLSVRPVNVGKVTFGLACVLLHPVSGIKCSGQEQLGEETVHSRSQSPLIHHRERWGQEPEAGRCLLAVSHWLVLACPSCNARGRLCRHGAVPWCTGLRQVAVKTVPTDMLTGQSGLAVLRFK